MSRFRWSSLYPRAWRKQFGDEFDAMLEMSGVPPQTAVDILWNAAKARCSFATQGLPLVAAWILVAWLNIYAREVQWPAAALVLTAFGLTVWHRKRWLQNMLLLFGSIPISSLYFYQIPGIHHEPLYKTAIALIPAFVGASIGLLVSAGQSAELRKGR